MPIQPLMRGQSGATRLNERLPMAGTPVAAVAAQGTLTIGAQVTPLSTMTIGTKKYRFVTTAVQDGDIAIGANEAATKLAIPLAINGEDGINTPHPLVTAAEAFTSDTLVITAITAGTAGNAIPTTENMAHSSNTFDATTLGTTTAGVNGVASQGTLTVDTQVTAGNTMTIGDKTYTFTAAGEANADGEIDLGASLAATQENIVNAINGIDGLNDPHPLVTAAAFVEDACVITARSTGATGDTIATTETFTAATNIFDATTLGTTTAGVTAVKAAGTLTIAEPVVKADTFTIGDKLYTIVAAAEAENDGDVPIGSSEANSKLAIVASINGLDDISDPNPYVTAAAFSGDDCVLTAKVKGTTGNAIPLAETFASAENEFSEEMGETEEGVDGTVGKAGQMLVDSSYLYIAIDDVPGYDSANWKKITLAAL